MSEHVRSPHCLVTCTSGSVVIEVQNQEPIAITPCEAVAFSTRLLEAAALARGQSDWNRG